ncbi:Inositol-3-phosphate synthase isozyme 1 [Tritrichomonas foetus]|uniref:Inositol-3-phosphate synthase n=1 Tax=Tritrichomonas foetus TaxID=1144522 RepID=A0A1J4JL99_9EUKA|nr:Inositol-3-phosphate synthase isozyme 1 [Tritrichomonas foetus]|eukprot:OHS98044.1 Inositol-3-phosphate synthase isozyme 1 [Tritrichomonas foetus]
MLAQQFQVNTNNVTVNGDESISTYQYHTQHVETTADGKVVIVPECKEYQFKTNNKVPRTGVMIVGLGGNNGTTLTAGVLANKLKLQWESKRGPETANYYGSLTQCATTYLGDDLNGKQVVAPFNALLPMVNPNDLVIGGWDISKANLYDATVRARVHEPTMYHQIEEQLKAIHPLPAVFDLSFVAPNQETRADNVLKGTKREVLDQVREQIRNFKKENNLEQVIILWSANTERYCEVTPGVHDTAANLLKAIDEGHPEISPSIIYAVASVLEGVPYINGSPQNTFVKGFIELAVQHHVPIMGDDFKTGQTKFKTVISDFLISSGLKLTAVASYNHLGNNDGLNLSFESCFRSKQISKASVIDDMVRLNPILYQEGEHPDHIVVIKYVPSVGDSKRALDEYDSDIFCGGKNIISVHNTCEDSLLAAPLMLDLVVLMELFTRVQIKSDGMKDFDSMHQVYSVLSFLLKAPQVPPGTPVINSLFQQRACLENILRACRGLQPLNHMHLEYKLPQ